MNPPVIPEGFVLCDGCRLLGGFCRSCRERLVSYQKLLRESTEPTSSPPAFRPRREAVHMPRPLSRLPFRQADAACRGQDPNLWHPHGKPGQATIKEAAAKAVCAGCEVREECLAYALEADEPEGIWGGLNQAERRQLRAG